MYYVDEAAARELVTMSEAVDLVDQVFRAQHSGRAEVFPVAMGHGTSPGTRFGVKSGLVADRRLVGLKVGTYWPANRLCGLPAHGSTTLLLNDTTGQPRAFVAASHLTALRTAAADGAATRALSRANAESVAIVGAGHQAWYELTALCAVRPVRRVRIWNRSTDGAQAMARRVREALAIDAEACDLEDAVRQADIIVTVTAATGTLFPAEWVRPGTHVSSMGADAGGKQELDPELVATARLFADDVAQSLTLGEFEAAHIAGLIGNDRVTPLGAVLAGASPGRQGDADITVFDSSGIAVQDLVVAQLALEKAIQAGRATRLA